MYAMRPARVVLLLAVAACQVRRAEPPAEAWRRAEELWARRDPGAFRAWRAIDPASAEGRTARRRLDEAELRYRAGIGLLGAGDPGAREALRAGVEIAPMDPALYLPLARACRDRGYPS